jgi:hypothetical protein
MLRRFRIGLTLALLASPAAAQAKDLTILARCGPSTGRSFYFEGGIVGPGRGGWQEDGISDGRLTILINEQDQLDIWSKDAVNSFVSYLKEGYKLNVIQVDQKSRTLTIHASGPMFSETYQLRTNEFGLGTLIWTQSKITQAITKTAVMQANCGPQYAIKP